MQNFTFSHFKKQQRSNILIFHKIEILHCYENKKTNWFNIFKSYMEYKYLYELKFYEPIKTLAFSNFSIDNRISNLFTYI